jgi:hypothetical protein
MSASRQAEVHPTLPSPLCILVVPLLQNSDNRFSVTEKLHFEFIFKQNLKNVTEVDTLSTAVSKIRYLVSSAFYCDVNIYSVLCSRNDAY